MGGGYISPTWRALAGTRAHRSRSVSGDACSARSPATTALDGGRCRTIHLTTASSLSPKSAEYHLKSAERVTCALVGERTSAGTRDLAHKPPASSCPRPRSAGPPQTPASRASAPPPRCPGGRGGCSGRSARRTPATTGPLLSPPRPLPPPSVRARPPPPVQSVPSGPPFSATPPPAGRRCQSTCETRVIAGPARPRPRRDAHRRSA